jgi:hypothetical protein
LLNQDNKLDTKLVILSRFKFVQILLSHEEVAYETLLLKNV